VPILNDGFAPIDAERDWASRVLTLAPTSDAAFTLDNRMVDAPVLARARRTLDR